MSFARNPSRALRSAEGGAAGSRRRAVQGGGDRRNEVAIVSLDGRPVHLMTPWQMRVYWKVATRSMSSASTWRRPRVDRASSGDDRA